MVSAFSSSRHQSLHQLAQFLSSHTEAIAKDMHQTISKVVDEAQAEVYKSVLACEYVLNFPWRQKAEDFLSLPLGYSVEWEPYGNILAIMPWNFPLWQLMRVLPFALITGNRILHKPAPEVWEFWQKWGTYFEQILGQECYQNCFWSLEEVKQKILTSEVDAITLTGSVRAGREVYQLAARAMKKCVLELGGSDVFLMGGEVDPRVWIPQAFEARMINMGQSCIAAKRFLLPQQHLEGFLKELKNFLQQNPLKLRLVHERAHALVQKQIEQAQVEGARLIYAAKSSGLPAVLLARGHERFWREEEFFAPVFLVSTYADLEDALQKANDCSLALGASLWGFSSAEQEQMIRGLDVGMVFVNEKVQSHPAVPFGGRKLSALGYELGVLGFLEWAHLKIIKRPM